MKALLLFILSSGFVLADCPKLSGAAKTVLVGDESRTFVVDGPATTVPLPMLIVLHDKGGSGASIRKSTGTPSLLKNFIAVYPDSRHSFRSDDTAFIKAVVDHMEAFGCADRTRLYIEGFRESSEFAQMLGCSMPTKGVLVIGGRKVTTCGNTVLYISGNASDKATAQFMWKSLR